MIDLAFVIDPVSRQDIRDRGMVYFLMKRYSEATADFETYLSLSPREDPDIQQVLTPCTVSGR